MKHASMARRLVVGFGGSFVLLTFLSGAILYALLFSQLRSGRDLVVQDRLESVGNLLRSQAAHGLEELKERVENEWPQRGGEKVFIRISDADGRVVTQTPRLPQDFDQSPIGYVKQVQALANSVGLKGPVSVKIAIGEEQTKDFLSILREVMLAVFVFNVFVSLMTGWLLVSRETRSLKWMSKKVKRIDSENLRERIELDGMPEEIRSLGQAFNHTLDRLTESFDRLSRFSSDIAHELRTPISNIMGAIEVGLSKPRTDDEYREILSSTIEECARISRLTESLLFLACAENLQRDLKIEKMNLKTEIDAILDFYEPLATDKGVKLSLSEYADKDQILAAETMLFQMAVGNLVSNAIRHTASGGRVMLDYFVEGNWVVLTVADEGEGISEKDLPMIFERFYRVDPSRNMASGGSGLGLAIARSIIELHIGTITVESELGHGTQFTMKWPRVIL